ncbi:MAG: alpha/beta hydrolase [Steroidobacteraceae bacterium]
MKMFRHILVVLGIACFGLPACMSTRAIPPPSSASQWAEVAPDVRLRYQKIGHGPHTLVLLHELGASLENWDEELKYWVRKDRTVIRYDQRGAGLSAKLREPWTMTGAAEDLLGLLNAIGVRDAVVLVGDTTGSSIALQFAAAHPERVAGVVALDPAAHSVPQPKSLAKFPDPLLVDAPLATLSTQLPDPANPDAAHLGRAREFSVVYPEVLRTDPRRYARFEGVAYSTDPTSALLTLRMLYSTGFAAVLPAIRCPVIVTGGTLFLRPMSEYREIAAAMPQGRFVELKTGHYPAVESPELVGPLVSNFLQELGW